jgi:hypothetical protein
VDQEAVQAVVLAYWAPIMPFVLWFREGYQMQVVSKMQDKTTLFDLPVMWCQFLVGKWNSDSRLVPGYHMYTLFTLCAIIAVIWLYRKDSIARFTAAWLLLPSAAMLVVFSNQGDSWAPRHVLFLSGSVFLLVGAACSRIKNRLVYALVLVLLFSFPAHKLYKYYSQTDREDWRSAVHYMTVHQEPGDVIAVYRNSNEWVFRHYYNGRAHWYLMNAVYFLPNLEDEYKEWDNKKADMFLNKVPKRKRQWLALSRLPKGAMEAIDPALRSNYRVLDTKKFDGVRLYLFVEK